MRSAEEGRAPERAWAVRSAIERLTECTEGGIVHLLAHGEDATEASRWLRAVTAGVAQQPDWEWREAAAAIDPGITGDRWWAKAERDAAEAKIRIVVAVEQEAWETAMAPEDDNAIYALRKRLAEAKRVHLVADCGRGRRSLRSRP